MVLELIFTEPWATAPPPEDVIFQLQVWPFLAVDAFTRTTSQPPFSRPSRTQFRPTPPFCGNGRL